MYPRCEVNVCEGVWAAGAGAGGAVVGAGTASVRHGTATAADTPFLPLWPAALLLNDDSLSKHSLHL